MNGRTSTPVADEAVAGGPADGVVAGGPEAGALAAVAGRYAERADADGVLAPEVVAAVAATGFARHFVPVRHGGAASGFGSLLEAVALVGEQCASTAWCAALAAGSARLGAYLPERGQAELWNDGPDTLVAAGLIPSGRAVRRAGGWWLTGEWTYTSGADFSDWVLLCAPVTPDGTGAADGGAAPRQAGFFALPRADYQVRRTWRSLGMRATASDTVVVTGAAVPDHRSVSRERIYRGEAAGSAARCHAVPLRVVSGLLFAAPALGAAAGAVDAWRARLSGESPGGERARLALARSAGEVDAARLLLRRAAEVGDRGPAAGADARSAAGSTGPDAVPDTALDTALETVLDTASDTALDVALDAALDAVRNPRDCALAVELLLTATDRLFRASGTRAQAPGDRVQRAWRDVSCVASHVALRFESAGLQYADHLLGVPGVPGVPGAPSGGGGA
ncbi:hydrolase [Streptosporangium sp. NPDC051022]|uniref:hydrolase n=1 Tax=Streptosporangium sp. NPDC051022 TaxID=3155752 RepID=UPI003414FFDD